MFVGEAARDASVDTVFSLVGSRFTSSEVLWQSYSGVSQSKLNSDSACVRNDLALTWCDVVVSSSKTANVDTSFFPSQRFPRTKNSNTDVSRWLLG